MEPRLDGNTAAEEAITDLCLDALGDSRFDIRDIGTALRTDSVARTRVRAAVRDTFGVDLSDADLARSGGVSDIAATIEKRVRAAFEDTFHASVEREADPGHATDRNGLSWTGRPDDAGIRPRSGSGPALLSFGQERLWFLEQLYRGSREYLVPLALRLTGRLRISALGAAVDEVVARHEVLRSRFVVADGQPVQVVDPAAGVDLRSVDLTALAGPARATALSEVLTEELSHPFDLAVGRLVRGVVVRLAAEEHVLLLVIHHAVFDGWSGNLLVRELDVSYAARVVGRASPLPPLPLQYADFATWQREWLSGSRMERDLGFWRDRLAGLGPLWLPTSRPRPTRWDPRGANVTRRIPAALASAFVEVGRRCQATPFMCFLAALHALLSRYGAGPDIAVGTPTAGRVRQETEMLIGFFVNTLVLRVNLSGNPEFVELLSRVRSVALSAYAHQELPFERVVEDLAPRRDLSRNPLFQVMFVLHGPDSGDRVTIGDLTAHEMRVESDTAKFDLTCVLYPQADGSLLLDLQYPVALFDAATVEQLARHYLNLLRSVVVDPRTRLSQLAILDDTDVQKLTQQPGAGAVTTRNGRHR